jgi:recombination protein U
MGYFSTRGLRGSNLEELINRTNRQYFDDDLAVIQKLPTSIKPVELDSKKGVITLAYFDERSTVDYMGNVQGIPICFDAKETAKKNLPIANIHEHQIRFMEKFIKQGGLAFMLVDFTECGRVFLLDYALLKQYWDGAQNGKRKSIPMEAFRKELEVFRHKRYLIHYLEGVETYLEILQKESTV